MKHPANRFKDDLGSGPSYGCWLGIGSAYAAEIVATAGFDWLLIDGEHAPNTVPSILAQLQAVAPYASAPVVRAVNHDPALLKQLLDIGAQSLMVPMVESAAQAEALVRATRYPPAGIRGMAPPLARAARWGAVDDYASRAHEQICLITQIESRAGVDDAKAIAGIDGVDALFVGPADLSASVGHAGNPAHPEVQELIAQVLAVARKAGKSAGILALNEADTRFYVEQGFDFIAVGLDVALLADSARALVRRYRRDC